MLKFVFVAIGAALAAAPVSFSWQSVISKTIAPGVVLTQLQQSNPPLLVDVVTVDRSKNRFLQVEAQVANGSLTNNTGDIRKGREGVTALAARTKAIAAVNGDYFPYTGDPVGFGVTNGEIYSEPYVAQGVLGRAAFGILKSGKAIIGIPAMTAKVVFDNGTVLPITGIDRLTSTTDPADAVICTPLFGANSGSRGGGTEIVLVSDRNGTLGPGSSISVTVRSVVVNNAVPAAVPPGGFVVSLPAGSSLGALVGTILPADHARIVVSLTDITPKPLHSPSGIWNDVANAVGGGPILLQNGNVVLDTQFEGIGSDIASGSHSRTGVGITKDGKVIIVTVDEGSNLSQGLTLQDFAYLMQNLGAQDAMNLDGGGSTAMAVNGQTVDYPSRSSWERPVADMLGVYYGQNIVAEDRIGELPSISSLPSTLSPGDTVTLTLEQPGLTIAGNDPNILWNGPVGSVGFVTQNGVFHVTGTGQGTITALYYGDMKLSLPVTIGAPNPTPTPMQTAPTVQPTPAASPDTDNNTGNAGSGIINRN